MYFSYIQSFLLLNFFLFPITPYSYEPLAFFFVWIAKFILQLISDFLVEFNIEVNAKFYVIPDVRFSNQIYELFSNRIDVQSVR